MTDRSRPSAEVIWTPAAEATLLGLAPWGATERAARAVYELAGSFDRAERRITVWHVFTY